MSTGGALAFDARKIKRPGSRMALYAAAVVLALCFLGPIVFIVLTSFMTDQQSLTKNLWPEVWQWQNFITVFEKAPMLVYLKNSMIYAGASTILMLVSSVPVAYGLSRLRWRGRDALFYLFIGAMFLPPQVVAVPLYVIWAKLGLTGTLWPLILPNLFGDPFSIFLLRQFLISLPQSYSDAARIDGASELQILRRIILPMARPGVIAAAIFSFMNAWNDYFGPLLYTGEATANWTLSLGLASFKGLHQVQWNLTMAATLIAMIPLVVIFLIAQRQFIEGLKFSGVKG